ncbi:AAA family ATPase [Saccharothrix sp. MB29]|nr:AAA family ATPase [Saccharothrix sp. MB29]
MLPLVDPDHRPISERSPGAGALVELDEDLFLPLPVNDRQLRVLTQVDAKAQTLVQGPPGTGKTHTVAALLSHLLAQGKRVLVTAHTDRALKEVRAKLPEAIAPLAVSVVGSSRSDLADLKVAVERISHVASEYDAEAARRAVEDHVTAIEGLRLRRAGLYRRLLDARGEEVAEHEVGDYRGTLATSRSAWKRNEAVRLGDRPDRRDRHRPSPVLAGASPSGHRSVVDDALNADEAESRLKLLPLTGLPTPRRSPPSSPRSGRPSGRGRHIASPGTPPDAVRPDRSTRTVSCGSGSTGSRGKPGTCRGGASSG